MNPNKSEESRVTLGDIQDFLSGRSDDETNQKITADLTNESTLAYQVMREIGNANERVMKWEFNWSVLTSDDLDLEEETLRSGNQNESLIGAESPPQSIHDDDRVSVPPTVSQPRMPTWTARAFGYGAIVVASLVVIAILSFPHSNEAQASARHEFNQTRMTVRRQLVPLQSADGSFWFDKIPFFTPGVRRALDDLLNTLQFENRSTLENDILELNDANHRYDTEDFKLHLRDCVLQMELHELTEIERRFVEMAIQDAPSLKQLEEFAIELTKVSERATEWHLLGLIQTRLRRMVEAEKAFAHAISSYSQRNRHSLQSLCLSDRAHLRAQIGLCEDAELDLDKCRALSATNLSSDFLIGSYCRSANAFRNVGKLEDAKFFLTAAERLVEARDNDENVYPMEHPLRAYVYDRLGWMHIDLEDGKEARNYFEKAGMGSQYEQNKEQQFHRRLGFAIAYTKDVDGISAASSEFSELIVDIDREAINDKLSDSLIWRKITVLDRHGDLHFVGEQEFGKAISKYAAAIDLFDRLSNSHGRERKATIIVKQALALLPSLPHTEAKVKDLLETASQINDDLTDESYTAISFADAHHSSAHVYERLHTIVQLCDDAIAHNEKAKDMEDYMEDFEASHDEPIIQERNVKDIIRMINTLIDVKKTADQR